MITKRYVVALWFIALGRLSERRQRRAQCGGTHRKRERRSRIARRRPYRGSARHRRRRGQDRRRPVTAGSVGSGIARRRGTRGPRAGGCRARKTRRWTACGRDRSSRSRGRGSGGRLSHGGERRALGRDRNRAGQRIGQARSVRPSAKQTCNVHAHCAQAARFRNRISITRRNKRKSPKAPTARPWNSSTCC